MFLQVQNILLLVVSLPCIHCGRHVFREECHRNAYAVRPSLCVGIPTQIILVPRALLTRGQPSATRGSGQIHIKLASDWPQRNIWFIVNMNKNTQALHEALVSLWRKLGEKTLLMLKEQQYEAVRKIVVDNRPQKR